MAEIDWPWHYSFPPFFTIQLHAETRSKQIVAWRALVLEYHRLTKQSVLDIREAQRSPLFNNTSINSILFILCHNTRLMINLIFIWHIYWHTLEEWGGMVYDWAQNNGMINTVCTLFELTQGDNTCDEEFHGLDTEVLIKALRTLEDEKKAEVIIFDDTQGVKFF
ncbi:unnamed protein product [Timema podura]|uniref:Vacuolar protein-sorting-associated protein 25 n=2 Tax=Timema TaxID=61471 RepID=A0A7R9PGM8_TIMGE|nr:unnamed protein product [Timema genevievae]CAG2058037.1 unnamed protein product [Timema podura]